MRRTVSSPDETRKRELKIRRVVEYFLTTFEVFHLVMKRCVDRLILLLKQWFLKEKLRMQKWAVFHLISKHSLNINFLCIFYMNYNYFRSLRIQFANWCFFFNFAIIYFQLIQELKKENFDLKLRLYMEQKEREVSHCGVRVLVWLPFRGRG